MSPSERPAPRALSPAPEPASPGPLSDFFNTPRSTNLSDLERQADDIIANFRARQGTGLDL